MSYRNDLVQERDVIQVVDRALRILNELSHGQRMSNADIARRLELKPSTVHGIVRTLLAHGMVRQDRDSAHYRLGPATLLLGNVYLDTLELRSRVLAHTEELARASGHAVRTGVLLHGDVVVVAYEPPPGGSRQISETGVVIPAHACALGKVLLAFNADGSAEALSPDQELSSMTAATITDPAQLRAGLESVRGEGIAYEDEEAIFGECGVAAPLLEPTLPSTRGRAARPHAAGAIGLVVPSTQWPLDPEAINRLRATARAISRQLGAPAALSRPR
jgi:DNA-binding IclR family transcriptional regulator